MIWNDLSDPKVSFALEGRVSSHPLMIMPPSAPSDSPYGTTLNLLFYFPWNKCWPRGYINHISMCVSGLYAFILGIKFWSLDVVWDTLLVSFTTWHIGQSKWLSAILTTYIKIVCGVCGEKYNEFIDWSHMGLSSHQLKIRCLHLPYGMDKFSSRRSCWRS